MKFFVIASTFCDDGCDFYFEPSPSVSVGEAPRCEGCGKFSGMLPLLPPVSGVLVANKRLFDLSASTSNELLASQRCLEAFATAEITGLRVPVPITLTGIDGPKHLQNDLDQYCVVEVAACGAEIDRRASGLRTSESTICPVCGYAGIIEGYERVCVAEGSWQGDDLFTLKGLPAILASQRVADLCRSAGLTVCSLVPAEQYRRAAVP